jgi:hypothetical protein
MKRFTLWLVSEKIYPRFLLWSAIVVSVDAISKVVALSTNILQK